MVLELTFLSVMGIRIIISLSSIRILSEFFGKVILLQNTFLPSGLGKKAGIAMKKAIFEICANLDIMAVGNLVMESPAKLPIRLYAETGSI